MKNKSENIRWKMQESERIFGEIQDAKQFNRIFKKK